LKNKNHLNLIVDEFTISLLIETHASFKKSGVAKHKKSDVKL